MNAEIISVGTELLLGNITNTNAQYLAGKLAELGISVYHQSVVGDNAGRLCELLEQAVSRSSVVVITGGLGATQDDITRETVCEAIGATLVQDEELVDEIREYYSRTSKPMPVAALKQAMVPEKNGRIFKNGRGTAPGIALENEDQCIIMLPGPPGEMIPMFEKYVDPYLRDKSSGVILSHSLLLFGISESLAEEKLGAIMRCENPTAAVYVKDGGCVELRITAKSETAQDAENLVEVAIRESRAILGRYVCGVDSKGLEHECFRMLAAKNLTLVTAESCTAGLLSKRLTDISGASKIFLMGVSTYSNKSKMQLLGVPKDLIKKHGAVSREVANAMAVGIRKLSGADLGIAITGLAGPDGATATKVVGAVHVALSDGKSVYLRSFVGGKCDDNRDIVRELAVTHALDLLRMYLEVYGTKQQEYLEMTKEVEIDSDRFNSFIVDEEDLEEIESSVHRAPHYYGEEKKSPAHTIFGSFLPWKGDSVLGVFVKLVRMAAMVVFLIAFAYLGNYYMDSIKTDGLSKEVISMYRQGDDADPDSVIPPEVKLPEGILQRFKLLYSKNSDIRGWIKIGGGKINKPVLQGEDNNFYLGRDFNKKQNRYGSIFLDASTVISPQGNSKNIVIYGHNMKDGDMFGELELYKDIYHYRANPVIDFSTIYEEAQWKVFAVFITNSQTEHGELFPYRATNFESDEAFSEWIEQIEKRSVIETNIDIRPSDQLLTLHTCTYDFYEARLIVMARKVRDGEDPNVDTSYAVKNPEPLYPDAWYKAQMLPVPTTSGATTSAGTTTSRTGRTSSTGRTARTTTNVSTTEGEQTTQPEQTLRQTDPQMPETTLAAVTTVPKETRQPTTRQTTTARPAPTTRQPTTRQPTTRQPTTAAPITAQTQPVEEN